MWPEHIIGREEQSGMGQEHLGPCWPWDGFRNLECNEEPLEDFHQESDMT